MSDTGVWQDGASMVGPEDGEFMTAIQKVHRETTACQNALNSAYVAYQREHDRILRSYWLAMQSITIGADAPEVTQVTTAIDYTSQSNL